MDMTQMDLIKKVYIKTQEQYTINMDMMWMDII